MRAVVASCCDRHTDVQACTTKIDPIGFCFQQRHGTSCAVHALMAWMSRRREEPPLQQGLWNSSMHEGCCCVAAVTDTQTRTHLAHSTRFKGFACSKDSGTVVVHAIMAKSIRRKRRNPAIQGRLRQLIEHSHAQLRAAALAGSRYDR